LPYNPIWREYIGGIDDNTSIDFVGVFFSGREVYTMTCTCALASGICVPPLSPILFSSLRYKPSNNIVSTFTERGGDGLRKISNEGSCNGVREMMSNLDVDF
jgi:hypothetical protein